MVYMTTMVYQNLILLMIQAKRAMASFCEERDLTPVQGMVLMMLEQNKARSMNELSVCMGCDASNITGLVDRLDAHDLIDRTTDENDRRIKMVRLSPEGEKCRDQLLQSLKDAEALDLQKLSTEELATLARLINKL